MEINNLSESIRPVSDFRRDLPQFLKKLQQNRHPIILTQRGRSVAVLIDIESYERLDYESRFRAAVREGLEDLQHGRTIPHEQVMEEMHKRLRRFRAK